MVGVRKGTPRVRNSDATKAAILDAARERFAASGYHAATVRAIAAQAGIDPALVIRYFGSKQNLFAVAAEFDLRLPDVKHLRKADVGATLVKHFFDRWEGDDTLMALLRTAATNEPAAQRMRNIFATQLVSMVGNVNGEPPSGAGVRAGLIATQMLGLALCRYVLKLPPVAAAERSTLVSWVGPTIQRYIFENPARRSRR
jgi:AcrR family transcriptional regulator